MEYSDFKVRHYMDSIYAVYYAYDGYRDTEKVLFRGSLADVNAWVDLKVKGFDV